MHHRVRRERVTYVGEGNEAAFHGRTIRMRRSAGEGVKGKSVRTRKKEPGI